MHIEPTIEKNIPVPKNTRNTGITAALRKMEIGDSFVLPLEINPRSLYPLAKQIGIRIQCKQEKSTELVKRFRPKLGIEIKDYKTIGIRIFRIG